MEKVRVACVGDSLTWGFMTDNQETDNYPAVLNEILGKGFEVKNFGVNGHTLSKSGDVPYWSHKNLQDALDWQPHIVIIMLGTNDAKPRNWQGVDNYVDDYQALIDLFLGLPSKPTLYLNTPPTVFDVGNGITYELDLGALDEMRAAVKALAAKNRLSVIDIGEATHDKPEFFPEDGVHTNTAGAAFIAKTVYWAILV